MNSRRWKCTFSRGDAGTGEGFRPFDLGPGELDDQRQYLRPRRRDDQPKLTVTYKGGEQAIVVDPKTPIVAFEPGAQTDLKPGAAIIARGPKQDDGSIDAAFVLVGKDGLVPPCEWARASSARASDLPGGRPVLARARFI